MNIIDGQVLAGVASDPMDVDLAITEAASAETAINQPRKSGRAKSSN